MTLNLTTNWLKETREHNKFAIKMNQEQNKGIKPRIQTATVRMEYGKNLKKVIEFDNKK